MHNNRKWCPRLTLVMRFIVHRMRNTSVVHHIIIPEIILQNLARYIKNRAHPKHTLRKPSGKYSTYKLYRCAIWGLNLQYPFGCFLVVHLLHYLLSKSQPNYDEICYYSRCGCDCFSMLWRLEKMVIIITDSLRRVNSSNKIGQPCSRNATHSLNWGCAEIQVKLKKVQVLLTRLSFWLHFRSAFCGPNKPLQ